MEIYQARQRVDDKRWDYTHTNSLGGYAIGYCAGLTVWDARSILRIGLAQDEADAAKLAAEMNAQNAPFASKYHTDGHATEEEACACHREYQLDRQLTFYDDKPDADHQDRCKAPECKAFTSGVAMLGNHRFFALCKDHRTRDVVKALLESA